MRPSPATLCLPWLLYSFSDTLKLPLGALTLPPWPSPPSPPHLPPSPQYSRPPFSFLHLPVVFLVPLVTSCLMYSLWHPQLGTVKPLLLPRGSILLPLLFIVVSRSLVTLRLLRYLNIPVSSPALFSRGALCSSPFLHSSSSYSHSLRSPVFFFSFWQFASSSSLIFSLWSSHLTPAAPSSLSLPLSVSAPSSFFSLFPFASSISLSPSLYTLSLWHS